ncbi:hypothetical protein KAX75_01210 [candidate division WOR-3 bacterium]|nr:hypothetical protein [candidate division WOR-3 bacterium]
MWKKILKKEIRSILREKAQYLFVYLFLPIAIFGFTFYQTVKMGGYGFMGKILVNFSVSHFSLSWFLLFSFIVLPDVFYRDKLQKILESLLTTPVALSEVLIGKSLAITLISLLIVWLEQVLMLLGVNLLYPNYNLLFPDLPAILIGFFIIPIFGFSFILITGITAFSSDKYRILSFILPSAVMGFFFFSAYKMKTFQPTWIVFYIDAFISLVLLLISLTLLMRLSKEDTIVAR